MTAVDEKIREAFKQEDSELLEHYSSDQSVTEMMLESFNSRRRWLVILVFVMITVFVGLLIVTGYNFFWAESTKAMIGWAGGFMYCAIAIAMMKIWYWMEMNKNSLTREMKRMELQIAELARRIEGSRES